MNDRGLNDEKPKFTSISVPGDGHTHIYRTDDEADFIRKVITDYAGEEFVKDGGRVTVTPEADGWVRIQINIPKSAVTDDGGGIGWDLHTNIEGKGWYDIKDSGQTEEEGCWVSWWIAKHKNGDPYI